VTGRSLTCFAVHAEALHEDDAWHATDAVLRRLESLGGRATLFVNVHPAVQHDFDLRTRVGELAARGHEIGQHTHYYRAVDGRPPATDMSPDNVRACLDRDFAVLTDMGIAPHGFVSGGWAVSDSIVPWLKDHGFSYDTTRRSYELPYESPAARAGDLHRAPALDDGLLHLPTTASLKRMAISRVLWWRSTSISVGSARFRIFYAHDYDLATAAKRWVVSPILRSLSIVGDELVTAQEMAALARPALETE
jgi:hypothetical protein